MDELGHILREARETKGFSLEDVQEEIRINAKYLQSLENGEYDGLPTPVHVRGFLRNYARFLGLDPQPLLDRYEANLSRNPAKPAARQESSDKSGAFRPLTDENTTIFYDPVNVEVDVGQRRDPESALRLVIVIALIIAVALVANRFVPLFLGSGDGSAAITEGINEALQDITNRAEATATAVATNEAAAEVEQTPVFVPGGIITSTGRTISSTPVTTMPTRPALPATMDEINLRLDISERTWMEVTIDGDIVFSGWARNGDPTYEWTAVDEAKINTGNGAGIFVTINDIPWGRMGARGENNEEIWKTTN